MSENNPFLLNNYIKPKYICSRKDETALILQKIENKEDILLISRMGLGKTTLIKNVFYNLEKTQKTNLVFLDLFRIGDIDQFFELFYNSVYKMLASISSNKLEKLKGIGLADFYDGHSKFDQQNITQLISNLDKLITFVGEQKKATVISIDNIQISTQYPIDKFEEIILKPLLSNENIRLILSGTRTPTLFPNSYVINIDKIPKKDYVRFISKIFSSSGRSISKKSLNKILNWSKFDISSVQLVCSKLWQTGEKKIKLIHVNNIIGQILNEYKINFELIRGLLSAYQWKLLTAIASEDEAIQVTSANFIDKHKLNAPSSVKTGLKALIEKELIYRTNNSYQLINPILSHWLAI